MIAISNFDELPDFLTVEETAGITRLPAKTLEYYRRSQMGPRWARVGRKVLYPKHDLRDWLAGKFAATVGRPA